MANRRFTVLTGISGLSGISGLAFAAVLAAALEAQQPAGEPSAGGAPAVGIVRSPQREFTRSGFPIVGFPTDLRLGLPSGDDRALRDYNSIYWRSRQRPEYLVSGYQHGYPGYWRAGHWADHAPYFWSTPWHIPQSMRVKTVREEPSDFPRLGLHYNYAPEDQLGIQMPVDGDAVEPAEVIAFSPQVEEAIALFRNGRYSDAGKLLAAELKSPGRIPIEVYTIIAELLMANGKYSPAEKVFRQGLASSKDLGALDFIDPRSHFPSSKEFDERMEDLSGQGGPGSPTLFLHSAMRLLSGDASALKDVEESQNNPELAAAARKLWLHFTDRQFDAEKGKGAADAPPKADSAAPGDEKSKPAAREPEKPKTPGF